MSQSSSLPPVTWLRAFEAAARHLSFTLAGRDLGLTQSAVSQHVRSLESFLGRELFVRKTRALALTEDGACYLPVVREAFELLSRGTEAFIGGGKGKTLTLQCNMGFSIYWLAPRLPRLYAQHPWLVLNIVSAIWDPERRAGTVEVEIRFGRGADVTPAAERLTHERYFPVCRPEYWDDGVDVDTARLFDCAGVTGTWSSWFASRGHDFNRSAQVNLGSTFVIALSAALAGAGFSMAHTSLATDLLDKGALIAPFDHRPELIEAYYLMPPASHDATPASRAFVAWLDAELGRAETAKDRTTL